MSTFCDDDQHSYEISSLFWSHNLFSLMSIQSQHSAVTQSPEFLLAAPKSITDVFGLQILCLARKIHRLLVY